MCKHKNKKIECLQDFVKDKPCLTWKESDSILKIVNNMRDNNTYAGVVVEDHTVQGLVTEHRILQGIMTWMADPVRTVERLSKAFNVYKARDVMITRPVTINHQEPIDKAYEEVMTYGYRYMPVTKNKNEIVGMLDRDQLIKFMQEKGQKELESKDMMLSYLMNHENYGGL